MTFSIRSKTPLFWAALAASPFVFGGCFVVEDTALNRLTPAPPGVDAGTLATSETCGDPNAINVMAGVYSVAQGNGIDTRTANGDVNVSTCASLPTGSPGPEVFVQFEAQAGQYWHFHVHPNNPAVDGGAPAAGDPVLLLYPVVGGSCNTTNCTYVSNRCPAGNDEHFGLEIPTAGEWALGIDNATAYGSLYDVTVFRPTCANNIAEHGEGCDDGNITNGDGCDDKCRVEVASATGAESEPNDDRFWANHVTVDAASAAPFVLASTHLVCDTDTFLVRVGPSQHLLVHIKNGAGTDYYTPAQLESLLGLEVRTTSGTVVGSVSTDGSGDAVIDVLNASAGTTDYFIYVTPPSDVANDALRTYRIELDVN